jgi:hypothetical protein
MGREQRLQDPKRRLEQINDSFSIVEMMAGMIPSEFFCNNFNNTHM